MRSWPRASTAASDNQRIQRIGTRVHHFPMEGITITSWIALFSDVDMNLPIECQGGAVRTTRSAGTTSAQRELFAFLPAQPSSTEIRRAAIRRKQLSIERAIALSRIPPA